MSRHEEDPIDDDGPASADQPEAPEPHRTGEAQARQNREEDPPV